MIYIDKSSCTGCAICVETCAVGAIHMEGNVAVIEQDECTECEACLDVCPEAAIFRVTEVDKAKSRALARQQAPEVIDVKLPKTVARDAATKEPTVWQGKVVPAVVGALAVMGRELPRLLPVVLDMLDRRSSEPTPTDKRSGSAPDTSSGGGGGRRRRKRRRGG